MNNNQQVSVIIPVYNVEEYLRQCLDSVINQTFKDIEIIIVNDCSTDNSLQIIEEYQKKDKRIKLIDLKQNVGLGNARNEGIKAANGKYLIFVDSDDWIAGNFIQFLYKEIVSNNLDFVSVNYNVVNDKITPNEIKSTLCNVIISDENKKKQILVDIPSVQTWTKIYKKDFLLSNNIFFRINKLEDNLFIWEVIIKSKSFLFVKEPLYYYRRNRKGSIIWKMNKKFYKYRLYLYKKIKQMLKDINAYQLYNKEFYYYVTIRMIYALEKQKRKDIFLDFRYNFYNNDYVLEYKYSKSFLLKVKLFIFKLCLVTNINYRLISNIYAYVLDIIKK